MLLFPLGSGCVEALQEWLGDIWSVGNKIGVPFLDGLDGAGPGWAVAHLKEFARAFVEIRVTSMERQRGDDHGRASGNNQGDFFGMRLVACVRAGLGVEGKVRARDQAEGSAFGCQVVQVVENSQQPWATSFITKEVRSVRLPVGVH